MKLNLNQWLDNFQSKVSPEYQFIADPTRKAPPEAVFYPNKKPLFSHMLVFTFAIGLSLVFVALLTVSTLISQLDYFDSVVNITGGSVGVYLVLLAITIALAVVARLRYRSKKKFLEEAARLQNRYRDGVYFLKEGLVFRNRERIDMFPYDQIERIRRVVQKHELGRDTYRFQVIYRNADGTSSTFYARENYFGLDHADVWNNLRHRGIEVDEVRD
ncbi:hypothetical protein SAMN05421823_102219 [Catalinimonas alkaloidigena]|uniref:Uncharacterized protein n=1 Tax=Catalinimonas alkaloidigena TaxID=1075417 RepID=A0A1G9ABI9_9BACT|nr:hypothetical protein [Catalinimonas alkaloidigena]SDK23925.1 hypothetical protein SAMN05421823_102219 [Catalinimonas alkaloidigena]